MLKYPKTLVRDCLKKKWKEKSQFSVVFKPVEVVFSLQQVAQNEV